MLNCKPIRFQILPVSNNALLKTSFFYIHFKIYCIGTHSHNIGIYLKKLAVLKLLEMFSKQRTYVGTKNVIFFGGRYIPTHVYIVHTVCTKSIFLLCYNTYKVTYITHMFFSITLL